MLGMQLEERKRPVLGDLKECHLSILTLHPSGGDSWGFPGSLLPHQGHQGWVFILEPTSSRTHSPREHPQRHLLGRAGLCPSGFLGAQKQGY